MVRTAWYQLRDRFGKRWPEKYLGCFGAHKCIWQHHQNHELLHAFLHIKYFGPRISPPMAGCVSTHTPRSQMEEQEREGWQRFFPYLYKGLEKWLAPSSALSKRLFEGEFISEKTFFNLSAFVGERSKSFVPRELLRGICIKAKTWHTKRK